MTVPRADGTVDGVLAIDLEPGWKTYWIDPGPVGLAPQIDFSASEDLQQVAVDFPAPVRFKEGAVVSAGYTSPVLLPFMARTTSEGLPQAKVRVVLGLCRELCVPVSAALAARPSPSLSARAEVLAARRALPQPSAATDVSAEIEDGSLIVRAAAKEWRAAPDAFVYAGSSTFGPPLAAATRSGGVWIIRFPAMKAAAGSEKWPRLIDLVLTSGEIARSYVGIPVEPAGADHERRL